MKKLSLTALVAVNILCLAPACGDDGSDDGGSTTNTPATPATVATETDPTSDLPTTSGTTGDETSASDPSTDPGETTSDTTDATTGGGDSELCTHLGGQDGVIELTTTFLTTVIVDDRVNAYFLTNTLDVAALGKCVSDQLGEAAGCAGVTYACKSMLDAHAGLGISATDFGDFAEDFGIAWDVHAMTHTDLTQAEKDAVIGVLAGMAPDIVEDADNNLTVYQRVGRKPSIKGLIGYPDAPGSFVANVAADASINGFFGATDFDRLNTCLTRQVHSIDGPNTYGLERDGLPDGVDPGASQAAPCRDMMSSHAGLVDANDNMGISLDDFVALVTDLITAMEDAGVPMDDQDAILGALGPLCPSIVTVDPENCP